MMWRHCESVPGIQKAAHIVQAQGQERGRGRGRRLGQVKRGWGALIGVELLPQSLSHPVQSGRLSSDCCKSLGEGRYARTFVVIQAASRITSGSESSRGSARRWGRGGVRGNLQLGGQRLVLVSVYLQHLHCVPQVLRHLPHQVPSAEMVSEVGKLCREEAQPLVQFYMVPQFV